MAKENTASAYEILMDVTDQGIGAYQTGKRAALRRLASPTHIIASIIAWPIRVQEQAGIIPDAQTRGWFGKIYAALIQVLAFALLAILATYAGKYSPMVERVLHALMSALSPGTPKP